MPLPAIALSMLGAGTVYFVAKVASSGAGGSVVRETAKAPAPRKETPLPLPPKVVTKEPPPAKIEAVPPPVTPKPPVDTSPKLPTPPPPVTVAPPPPPVTAPPPAPVAKLPEPPPARVEAAPPPAAPTPPPDTSAALPTPTTPRLVPDGPMIDVPVGDKYAEAAAARAATPSASAPAPTSAPSAGPPAGFDATLASTLAPALAKQLASKGYDYDRQALRGWQTAAGLLPDGIYGDDSWGALLFFTSAAPKALFKPSAPTPYPWAKYVTGVVLQSAPTIAAPPAQAAPPPDTAAPLSANVGPVPPPGWNPVSARNMAKQVANHIQTKGSSYTRQIVKDFQKVAGLDADGIYGGGTRGALIFYGVPRPPSALFKPTATTAYPWAAQAAQS